MKLQELVEMLQVTHPGVSVLTLIKALNRASNDFCRRTECVESSFHTNEQADQRFYDLPKEIIRIFSIDVNGETAPKLIGRPTERDIT